MATIIIMVLSVILFLVLVIMGTMRNEMKELKRKLHNYRNRYYYWVHRIEELENEIVRLWWDKKIKRGSKPHINW